MRKYIEKAAVVAEIERRIKSAQKRIKNVESIGDVNVVDELLVVHLKKLLSFVNALEVKKVYSEEEVKRG